MLLALKLNFDEPYVDIPSCGRKGRTHPSSIRSCCYCDGAHRYSVQNKTYPNSKRSGGEHCERITGTSHRARHTDVTPHKGCPQGRHFSLRWTWTIVVWFFGLQCRLYCGVGDENMKFKLSWKPVSERFLKPRFATLRRQERRRNAFEHLIRIFFRGLVSYCWFNLHPMRKDHPIAGQQFFKRHWAKRCW